MQPVLTEPKVIFSGSCENSSDFPPDQRDQLVGSFDLKACNAECLKRSAWCTHFFLGVGLNQGNCTPYASGCRQKAAENVVYY